MSRNLIRLPTATDTYITIHKARCGWDVVLVTPCPGRALRTRLYGFDTRDGAEAKGREVAGRMHRPFKAKAATGQRGAAA